MRSVACVRRLVLAGTARKGVAAPSSARCLASLAPPRRSLRRSPPPAAQTAGFPSASARHPAAAAATPSPLGPRRWLSSGGELPYHVVMGMPALSPTMEMGTISKWNVAEGDSFAAGDSLAVIETDKATIDFEAQDDGVVGKLLATEGGEEIKVGVPIIVVVEEEGDVAAFADFVPDAAPAAAAAPSDPAPAAAPEAAAPDASADLPYHVVVGMPALSPTMEAGTISKWNVAEGAAFAAGDSLAVIETDKASIDFEAQDDGVLAKILVDAGAGEVTVGTPIMVTCEEEGDAAAFANFVAGAPEGSVAKAEVEAEAPAAAVEAPAIATAPAPKAPSLPEAPVPAPTAPPPLAASAPPASSGGASWGRLAAETSPLARLLASKQKEYTAKYGSTGHAAIV